MTRYEEGTLEFLYLTVTQTAELDADSMSDDDLDDVLSDIYDIYEDECRKAGLEVDDTYGNAGFILSDNMEAREIEKVFFEIVEPAINKRVSAKYCG